MTTFNTKLFLCAAFVAAICLSAPGYADDLNPVEPVFFVEHFRPTAVTTETPTGSSAVWIGTQPSATDADAEPLTGLKGWLATYNETLKMHNASIFTTIFGAAFVAFFIAIAWGKLVELYGALGGLIGGGAIVGTFWVINHKLPGFGFGHDGFARPEGDMMGGAFQYGLIVQTGPWIDMGLAVCVGLFTASFLEGLRAKKLDPSQPCGGTLLAEVFPRAISVILGGMVGGAIVGLIGFTGARLF